MLQLFDRKITLFTKQIAERPSLVENPDVHRLYELFACGEVELHGKDAKKQIAVGGRGRHGGHLDKGALWLPPIVSRTRVSRKEI
jgi:hypothetical protein